jgi:hypothetical protein
MVYTRGERAFFPEHYLSSKSFAAVRESYINLYPDTEVPNKTTVLRVLRSVTTVLTKADKYFCS